MRCSRARMRPLIRTRSRWLIPLVLSLSLVAGCGKDPTKPNAPPAQTEFHVNAATGLDTNDGTITRPFKTITHALAVADTGHWIHVQPGTYDTTSGEKFPLVLKVGQTLTGDTLNKGAGPAPTVVQGIGVVPGTNPTWIDQYATVVGARGATISGLRIGFGTSEFKHFAITMHDAAVTIANNTFDAPAYGGVYLTGDGASLVRANVFHGPAYGLFMIWTASVVAQDNDFIDPNMPIFIHETPGNTVVRRNWITGSGAFGIVVESGTPRIDGNSFAKTGGYPDFGAIFCTDGGANPKVRNNQLQFCALGIRIQNGQPDLGTAEDPGLNFFYVNGVAVRHSGGEAITAIGNVWPHSPPTPGVDIIVSGAGSVRWGTGASEIVP